MRQFRAGLALTAAAFFALAGLALPVTASASISVASPPAAHSAGAAATARTATARTAMARTATARTATVARAAGAVPMANPTPVAAKKLVTIKDARIKDSSGLAKSVKHEGVYWAVKNTGDTARVLAIDTSTGKVKAVLRFNAALKDVEAVGVDRDGTIYVADIGDNTASRDMIEIYTIPEPETLQDQDVKYHRFDFTYPDGPHDAETLLIEPGTNQLYIVTKATKGTGMIYAAPPAPTRQGTNELTELAPAPPGAITDGTFLPDGQSAVLRTDTDMATVAWGDTPTVIARGAVPFGQGKTVAVGPTDTTVLTLSEGANAAIYQVVVPTKAAAATPPAASATPKAASSDEGDSSSGKSNNLTWILVGAAVFAFVITIITFPPGRRERRDRMAENARLTGQSPPTHRRHHS